MKLALFNVTVWMLLIFVTISSPYAAAAVVEADNGDSSSRSRVKIYDDLAEEEKSVAAADTIREVTLPQKEENSRTRLRIATNDRAFGGDSKREEEFASGKGVRYLQQVPGDPPSAENPYHGDLFVASLLDNVDHAYVDKSLLIKELQNEEDIFERSPLSLIRPRRSGKSTNLCMVRKFFEIEVNENGTRLSAEERMNGKFFTGGEICLSANRKVNLERLKIADEKDIMRLQGTYPVILLNLTSVTGTTYKQIETQIGRALDDAVQQHRYLRRYYAPVNESTADLHHKIQKLDVEKLFARHEEYARSSIVHCLCEFIEVLSKHFNRSVYVLVDEFDRPLIHTYTTFDGAGDSAEFMQVRSLLGEMFETAFQKSEYLKRAVLTGTLPTDLSNYRGGFHTSIEYTTLDSRFSAFFGFTTREFDQLVTRFPTKTHPSHIKSWYGGYNYPGEVIYNSYSVMQCLRRRHGQLDYYWLEEGGGGNPLIHAIWNPNKRPPQSFNVSNLLLTAANAGVITTHLEANIELKEGTVSSLLYDVLVFEGYLSAVCGDQYSDCLNPKFHLTIPNREMEKFYHFQQPPPHTR